MKTNPSEPKVKAAAPDKAPVPTRRHARGEKAPASRHAVLDGLEPINSQAAGIDVGSKENFVAVPPRAVKAGDSAVRSLQFSRKNRTHWSSG